MSQYDFGNLVSPLPGSTLINTHLEPFRDALHSNHSGSSRPSYATAVMMWINTTTTPWVVNFFDGTDDIPIGTINATTNIFTPNGAGAIAFTGNNSHSGTETFSNAAGVTTNVITERTADAGVTADGVLLKDSQILANMGDNVATNHTGLNVRNAADTLRVGIGAYGLSNKNGTSQVSDFTCEIGSEFIISATDGLRVGSSGTPFKNVFSATASLDFGSIPANSSADLTITVTGATTSNRDDVGVGLASSPNTGLIYQGFVSAADTVTIRACNFTTSAINPSAQTIRATVTQY